MENIGQLIKQISNKLINNLNKNLKSFDITVSQLQVMLLLQEANGTMCQKEIAENLKIRHTSLIDILKVLERKELVSKNTSGENAKFNEIALTKSGTEILNRLDFGKDKTEEMMRKTLGFSSTNDMLYKFKEVLKKLEEGDYQ